MVIVGMIEPSLLLYTPGSIFWGVKYRDHYENIFINL